MLQQQFPVIGPRLRPTLGRGPAPPSTVRLRFTAWVVDVPDEVDDELQRLDAGVAGRTLVAQHPLEVLDPVHYAVLVHLFSVPFGTALGIYGLWGYCSGRRSRGSGGQQCSSVERRIKKRSKLQRLTLLAIPSMPSLIPLLP